jgi:Fur-regulated basic protein A
MGELSRRAILSLKEQVIQELLKMKFFKAPDDRQLYELTLNELENEFKALKGVRCRN